MERNAIIATTVGTVGILAAGTIAGVAVYKVSSQSNPNDPSQSVLVAASAQPSSDVVALESFAPADLPAVPAVDQPAANGQGGANQPRSKPGATQPATENTTTGQSTTSNTNTTGQGTTSTKAPAAPAAPVAPSAITKGQATVLVLNQAPGMTMQVTEQQHQGYASWAVQVQRSDGSVVTGFVDQSSGVIFDWVVDKAAPQPPQAPANPQTGNQGGGEHEGGEGGEHEGGEHEGGDDD